MSSNTYTIEKSESGFVGGRYNSKTPGGAAKKAATRLFRTTNKKSLKFTIRQTTQGSDKKLYKYEAKRVKLAKPVIIKIKGNEIKYEYKTEVKALEIKGGDYSMHRQPIMKGGGTTCDSQVCSFD
jgi:hypothetical protein